MAASIAIDAQENQSPDMAGPCLFACKIYAFYMSGDAENPSPIRYTTRNHARRDASAHKASQNLPSIALTRTMHALRNNASKALDLLLPPQCPMRDEPVAKPGQLSGPGWADLHFIEPPCCPGCSIPFSHDHGPEILCANCLADNHLFSKARASIVYDDYSHKLIVSFKHGDRTELAPMMAGWMTRAGRGMITAQSLLVPVPLHRKRLLARRFNQSALLAQGIAKRTGTAYLPDHLIRKRATVPQKDLSSEARRRNVAGAFALRADHQSDIKGRHVILVDDVLTTGATLSACARPLLAAGAAQVDALVLARVVKDGAQAI